MRSRFFLDAYYQKINTILMYFFYFWNLNITWQKTAFYQKNHFFKKIWLDDQHFHASESKANFWIYIGNQQQPKLSSRTYGCSHVYLYWSSCEKSWVKMRRNLKFHFWLDLKRAIFFYFFLTNPKITQKYQFYQSNHKTWKR